MTESNTTTSYLHCILYTDNGKLITRLYDKRDNFNFPIVNFPFLSSKIPLVLAYEIYASKLVRYAETCCKHQDFVDRGKLLTNKLFLQGYRKAKLVLTVKSSMNKTAILLCTNPHIHPCHAYYKPAGLLSTLISSLRLKYYNVDIFYDGIFLQFLRCRK